ncbi:acVLRF1 family peptidyl-tRNA hydrolase [Actinoplanes sichuanensis]|uniref:AcVLRF1 family peptidyl-tRNA hydrolase n=1 Tax=Actinoplanes sichuanensis TaxID=512349 RepID=A0ABW4ACV9_9ACTN|nr:acVLRF1 family peptidyl-tRNA hydrolase [Actinoplanes sichuanensis]BEL08872.1 acVLRF1 family peptidyl-tRNA hydrolase [Actinoplanes sichuanensis]
MGERAAAGGGKWVDVAPERLPRWLANFGARHGSYTEEGLTVIGSDGASATLHEPPGVEPVEAVAELIDAARAPRRLGLLLARKGAVAVGIADGVELVASKVDTHYVQGRTAAGGWSQQRFARRRDNQAKAASADAAGIVGRILLPEVRSLAALVAGGDRSAVDAILAVPQLSAVAALRTGRMLDVPEPRHAVLVSAVAAARAVPILIREP